MQQIHHEDDLTTLISEHAKLYIARRFKTKPYGYKSASSSQSSENYDKYCFDLAVGLNEWRLILLEIKHLGADDAFFHHFPSDQFASLTRLERLKFPVRYCYNIDPKYSYNVGEFYSLVCCLTSKPSLLLDGGSKNRPMLRKGDHIPLMWELVSIFANEPRKQRHTATL